ncbi:MAG: glycosyltransferase family 2 protein [Oscillospiraceae bacterium]|nr:glycosyltransferase family 2 protein [Oscillospiraceae bacterium]
MDREKSLLFVIPVYNEEKNIRRPVEDIRHVFGDADIIAVNDNSSDGTIQVLKELGVNYLNLPLNLGYSGAVQTGIIYANRNNYDYVIQFDGDGQHKAKEAVKLYDGILTSGSNIIIGSRFLDNTGYKHPFFRKIGTALFSFMIKVLTGKKITDPTSGFQIQDKKTIKKYSIPGEYPEFPDANLIARMILEGYVVSEVSCEMAERTDGVSMHAGIIKPIKYAIKCTYSLLLIGIFKLFGRKSKNV